MRVRVRSLWGMAALVAVLAALIPPAAAQRLPERHRRWLEEQVGPTITDAERAVFLSLRGNAAREVMIRSFWAAREPRDPEHRRAALERRIEEADRRFGGPDGPDGSLTDRGRTYVQLGAPWDRRIYTGVDGVRSIEDWIYASASPWELPPFFHVLFYADAAGSYRRYSPVDDGPGALLSGPAPASADRRDALRKLVAAGPDLASAALSADAADPIDASAGLVRGEAVSLERRLWSLVNRLPLEMSYLDDLMREQSEVGRIVPRATLFGTFDPVGPAGQLHLVVELNPDELVLTPGDAGVQGRLRLVGRIRAEDDAQTIVSTYDERIAVELDADGYAVVRDHPFAFGDALPMLPGAYRVELVLRDETSGRMAFVQERFVIPAREPSDVAVSPLLIVAYGSPAPEGERRPFTVGRNVWYPLPRAEVAESDPLRAVYQLSYPPSKWPEGHELGVRYHIDREGDELIASFDRLKLDPAIDHGLATDVVEVRLHNLPPGSYVLRVVVVDGPRTLATVSHPFTVRTGPGAPPAWAYMNARDRGAAATREELARQALALDNGERAEAFLRQLFDDPQYAPRARLWLARLLARRGEPEGALTALDPLIGAARPQAVALVLASELHLELGQADQAAALLRSALEVAPNSIRALNLLGDALVAGGAPDRGIEPLKRSLELDPDQESVRQKLATLESPSAARR